MDAVWWAVATKHTVRTNDRQKVLPAAWCQGLANEGANCHQVWGSGHSGWNMWWEALGCVPPRDTHEAPSRCSQLRGWILFDIIISNKPISYFISWLRKILTSESEHHLNQNAGSILIQLIMAEKTPDTMVKFKTHMVQLPIAVPRMCDMCRKWTMNFFYMWG